MEPTSTAFLFTIIFEILFALESHKTNTPIPQDIQSVQKQSLDDQNP